MSRSPSLNLFDRSFIDYYDEFAPVAADFSLARSIYSSILSRPNQLSFFKNKLKLNPAIGYRVTDENVDRLLGAATAFVAYYDEEVHNGAGKKLCFDAELRDAPNQPAALKQLIGMFVTEFVPTTLDPFKESISTSYVRIGNREYWVEYRSRGWTSNHTAGFTTRLLSDREVAQDWQAQVEAIAASRTTLAKAPLLSIDFLADIQSSEVFALDLNLAPKIGQTAIAEVLSGADCWAEISRYVAENLENLYDYLLIANEVPAWVQAPDFRLTKLVQLRYLPAGTCWQCIEDGSYWKYLHGQKDSQRYFWRLKTSSGRAGVSQLDRNQIFNGRSYRVA